jgi:hypothetical protein
MRIKWLILILLFISCEIDESCTTGQKQRIDELCYECEKGEWVIIDCRVMK